MAMVQASILAPRYRTTEARGSSLTYRYGRTYSMGRSGKTQILFIINILRSAGVPPWISPGRCLDGAGEARIPSMRSSFLVPIAFLVTLLALSPAIEALPASDAGPAPGDYDGWFEFPRLPREELHLRIVEKGLGLVNLPGRDIYGYPLEFQAQGRGVVAFVLGTDERTALDFEGKLSHTETGTHIEGRVRQAGIEGAFSLSPVAPTPGPELPFDIAVPAGSLRGSLLLPEGEGPFPLALILGGAGATDRDGNNYAVPGRNDALKDLALGLRAKGVASLRYDKRGAGESFLLAPREELLRFDDYIEDARAALRLLSADARFSRILIVGYTEGALVGAAALAREPNLPGLRSGPALVLLAASAESARESLDAALAESPPELAAEAASIMGALDAGKTYPDPSPYFAEFFRPSFQPYLISWLRYDLKDELSHLRRQILLIQGDRDFQVPISDFLLLARLRPEAAAIVVPGMNHVLKEVPPDLDENYRSFSDPSFPLAPGLAASIAAFATGEALPEGLIRVDGGRLPEAAGEDEQDHAPCVVAPEASEEGRDQTDSPSIRP